ncbi:MAG: glycosyltransferase [Bdellovibrio sp.]|nr:glycosyltransferase [Bdellovibrio sp.]
MTHASLLWVVPEEKGGIRTYSEALWPAVEKAATQASVPFSVFPPLYDLIETRSGVQRSVEKIAKLNPTVIHVQHEYGLFGNKIPGFYLFPEWLEGVRRVLPEVKVFATAHNVLNPDYRFPLKGRGWQIPLRWLANSVFISRCQRAWSQETWGRLNGVFVHSRLQKAMVESSGCAKVEVIPHFVPALTPIRTKPNLQRKKILVFGFVTPDKGQDIAIEALSLLPDDFELILAGGPRRPSDENFVQFCRDKIKKLGLESRVRLTGFVSAEEVDSFYESASLVLAPFRESSGSGSLVQALGRGSPVLASDLPLNLEIEERVKGSVKFFSSGSPKSCAEEIKRVLSDPGGIASLSQAALEYARLNSPKSLADGYLSGYSV